MNIFKLTVLCAALALSGMADAKGGSSSGGGHSSGGGGRSSGGMSSGRSSPSYSSTSRPNSAPSVAPTNRPNSAPSIAPNSRPNSTPSISPNAPAAPAGPRTTSTTTTSTTTSRSYSRNVNYGGGMAYGGMGMGYGYSNGILTGLLIGSMLHPHNTVVYAGGGSYNNNALLYPDGRVVNQQGYQVGTYQNGQFTNVQNGAMVAQNAPADAYQSSQPQQVVIVKQGPTAGEITMSILVGIAIIVLIVILI